MLYKLITLNCRYSHSCLALFYLRQALAAHLPQASLTLVQGTINDPYYATLQGLLEDEPEALFFSVYIWNVRRIARLVADIRQVRPGLPIVLGGPQVSYGDDNQVLFPGCTVVRGPVEGVAAAVCHDLVRGSLAAEYVAPPDAPFALPYTDADFSGPLANRSLYYESSRGCPFACSYCLSSAVRGVHHLAGRQVRQELSWLVAKQPAIIRFVDRTFNADPARALAIWQHLLALREVSPQTVYHFEMAPDRFTDEMLQLLATVPPGMFQFEIGIQSTTAASLRAVGRRMNLAAATANIRRLVALDRVHLHVDLILGLPHETAARFRDSFRAVFALAPHYIQMGLLKVLPGTDLAAQSGPLGLRYCLEPPYEVLATNWLTDRELGELHRFGDCVEAFYNNRYFPTIWAYLRRRQEDPVRFFDLLLAHGRRHGLLERAKTQELLSRWLAEAVASRPDREVVWELLHYDWLRCGHRFLPEGLRCGQEKKGRKDLQLRLPQNNPPYYTYRSRDAFFKGVMLYQFSPSAAAVLKLPSTPGVVCFLPRQRGGVRQYCETIFLPFR